MPTFGFQRMEQRSRESFVQRIENVTTIHHLGDLAGQTVVLFALQTQLSELSVRPVQSAKPGCLVKHKERLMGAKKSSSLFKMRSVSVIALLGLATTMVTVSLMGAGSKVKNEGDLTKAPYPETVLKRVNRAEFRDPAYFKLMAADGIRSVDPKILFSLLSTAAQAGENYKALYFARIFTELQPNLPQGWANRAKLAAALGLRDEATASQARAESQSSTIAVPVEILPGQGLRVRPSTLPDWAAAIALLSDGTVVKEGEGSLIAVKDDVSGLYVSSAQDLADDAADSATSGLPPSGPWAMPKEVRVEDLANNLFSLRSPIPMREKNAATGSLVGAMLMAGAAGVMSGAARTSGDQQAAAQAATASGEMLGQAYAVPSIYSGGSYSAVTYRQGSPEATLQRPKASGKLWAVGNPKPILWSTGGSTSASFYGNWLSGAGKTPVHLTRPEDLKGNKKERFEHLNVPPLYYPKLAQLCIAEYDKKSCSIPVTLMEVLLTQSDVLAISSGLGRVLEWRVDKEAAYSSRTLSLEPVIIGFDQQGNAYSMRTGPSQWLVSVAAK